MDERGCEGNETKNKKDYHRDQTLTGCTYQEVKEVEGLQAKKTVSMVKGNI